MGLRMIGPDQHAHVSGHQRPLVQVEVDAYHSARRYVRDASTSEVIGQFCEARFMTEEGHAFCLVGKVVNDLHQRVQRGVVDGGFEA